MSFPFRPLRSNHQARHGTPATEPGRDRLTGGEIGVGAGNHVGWNRLAGGDHPTVAKSRRFLPIKL